MTTRRDFLKTAGVLTAATAFMKPSDIFAQKSNPKKISTSKKLQLDWENFDGIMKFTFTVSGSSRKGTPIVITRLSWNGYSGYGEASSANTNIRCNSVGLFRYSVSIILLCNASNSDSLAPLSFAVLYCCRKSLTS